jgi:hypothetical protein
VGDSSIEVKKEAQSVGISNWREILGPKPVHVKLRFRALKLSQEV